MKSLDAARQAALALVVGMSVTLAGCGGEDSGSDSGPDLSAPPEKLSYQRLQGVPVPVSGVSGPKNVGGYGAASGWEHSPQGAALAAINGAFRPIVADDKHWEEATSAAFAPSPGRDRFMEARVSLVGKSFDKSLLPTSFDGYKITDYSDDHSKVTVFTTYSDGSKASNGYELDWTGGDWKIHLPDDGNAADRIKSIGEFPNDMVKLEK